MLPFLLKRLSKTQILHNHLDECPQQLAAVEYDNGTADHIDDTQCLVCELCTE